MRKALFVLGPTAVGKTNIALKLAKRFDGEIVSADSIQVYKSLDIISGKDLPLNVTRVNKKIVYDKFDISPVFFETVPVYLIDVVDYSYSFNISDFKKTSRMVINNIWSRNKLPIIVGGNGFYISSFFKEIQTIDIPPDLDLRSKLSKKTISELQAILKKENSIRFEAMNNSDKNNPRRLIRAIEVTGKKFKKGKYERINSQIILINNSEESLKKKIEDRISERIKKGALKEAKRLFYDYKNLSPQVKNAIGYRSFFDYLHGKTTLNDAIDEWKISEINYVKRQMTWFKKMENFLLLDQNLNKELESKISEWYNH